MGYSSSCCSFPSQAFLYQDEKEMKTEKVPLLIIYKDGDKIIADVPESIIDNYQLYGFLKIYIKSMEEWLLNNLDTNDNEKKI